jgi:hypothetical protein
MKVSCSWISGSEIDALKSEKGRTAKEGEVSKRTRLKGEKEIKPEVGSPRGGTEASRWLMIAIAISRESAKRGRSGSASPKFPNFRN